MGDKSRRKFRNFFTRCTLPSRDALCIIPIPLSFPETRTSHQLQSPDGKTTLLVAVLSTNR